LIGLTRQFRLLANCAASWDEGETARIKIDEETVWEDLRYYKSNIEIFA